MIQSFFYIPNRNQVIGSLGALEAKVFYRNKTFDLLQRAWIDTGADELQNQLASVQLVHDIENPLVVHFFYEWGKFQLGEKVEPDRPLAIGIRYRGFKPTGQWVSGRIPKINDIELPEYSWYQRAFEQVQSHLLAGDCYQVNLTSPIHFSLDKSYTHQELLGHFFGKNRGKLGAYAHATYWRDHLDQENLILSNSPEALLQSRPIKNKLRVSSFPIKGTLKDSAGDTRHQLDQSLKDEQELFMIADMARNDLAAIDTPKVEIKAKKKFLKVPGLLHHYSHLSVDINPEVSALKLIQKTFPAASITGAPKKRVMSIIETLETSARGVYCGSTLLAWKKNTDISVNIRTAFFQGDLKRAVYGAGGGVTLDSEVHLEWRELLNKWESFACLW
jgi:anthranilate/para-aminobenzoate synthase component I